MLVRCARCNDRPAAIADGSVSAGRIFSVDEDGELLDASAQPPAPGEIGPRTGRNAIVGAGVRLTMNRCEVGT
jgi:hypothetical protein